MGNFQLVKRDMLYRPSNYTDYGMQGKNEPRTERCCLEGQMADSGLLESVEAGPHRLSGPSEK